MDGSITSEHDERSEDAGHATFDLEGSRGDEEDLFFQIEEVRYWMGKLTLTPSSIVSPPS